jgi:hypothetical protein
MIRLPRLAAEVNDRFALRLTLLVLLLRPPGEGVLRTATWLTAGAALVAPPLMERTSVWFFLTALITLRLVSNWPLADNHIYLLAYWCLAVSLSIAVQERHPGEGVDAEVRRASSRWLVGCAFLFAVLWKGVLAADYTDGRFFRVTLLTDDRFASLARAVGGLTQQQLATNRKALAPLPAGVETVGGPVLIEPPSLRRLAGGLTWGGLALEALVAAAFLLPAQGLVRHLRHPALLAFCIATYAVAPVAGFGWLLAILGLAHAPRDATGYRVAYIVVFALVMVYAETSAIQIALDYW